MDALHVVEAPPNTFGMTHAAQRVDGHMPFALFPLESVARDFVHEWNERALAIAVAKADLADDAALREMLDEECDECDGSCEGRCADCDEIARARADDANDARREHEAMEYGGEHNHGASA